MQPADAPVVGVEAPLDQPARFQAVHQTADGDRLDLEDFGQFTLRHAGRPLHPAQDDPLRPGHAMQPGALIGLGANQPGEIVQQHE